MLFNPLRLLCCLTFIGLPSGLVLTQGQPATQQEIEANHAAQAQIERAQYIEITDFMRASKDEQQRQLPHIYQLFSQIKETNGRIVSSIVWMRAHLPKNKAELSTVQLADAIGKFSESYYSVEAKANGREALRANLDSVAELIHSDLSSNSTDEVKRGLETLMQLGQTDFGDSPLHKPASKEWYKQFSPDVTKIFESDSPVKEKAVWVLVTIGKPEAIELLIKENPENPVENYEAIGRLSSKEPDNPALLSLLPLLKSADAQRRYQALWALGGISLQILFPHIQRLLNDSDSQVRWLATHNAFRFEGANYLELRPKLVKALSDRDDFVRYIAASGFADKHDAISEPTLLELLKSKTATLSIKAAVADDVRKLMGPSFEYIVDGAVPPQSWVVERNALALEKFEKWIRENPVKNNA